MFVGYLRSGNQPGEMAKLLAISCKTQGLELLYFTPFNVDIKNQKIFGKIYLKDKWVDIKTDIPVFIDVTAYVYSKKNRAIFEFLDKHAVLSDNRLKLGNLASQNPYIISKEAMNDYLESFNPIKKYLIPTQKVNEFNDIIKAVDIYGKVVLKPLNGLQGKGVFLIFKLTETEYRVEYKTISENMNKVELHSLYEKEFNNERYVFQKYISSRTPKDDPFDCRIHLEKNGLGKWIIVKKAIRIGIGQKVISNVNQGGGIADCQQFLSANFGEQSGEIIQKLNNMGLLIAPVVEKIRRTKLMTLGLDVGITSKGEVYLFEVNGVPATTFAPVKIAFTRVEYYQFMLNKLSKEKNNGVK